MLIVAISALLTACGISSSKSEIDLRFEYFPVQEEDGEKWGLLGMDGNLLISEEFKNQPSVVINGLFFVQNENGLFTVYEASSKPKEILEDLVEVGFLADGLMPIVKKSERISIVDTRGETGFSLDPVAGKEIVSSAPFFTDGVLIAKNEDNKFGGFNRKGENTIDFKYNMIYPFNEGLAVAIKDSGSSEGKLVVISKDGNTIDDINLKESYTPLSYMFTDGYIPVKDREGSIRFINKKGDELKLPGKVKDVGDYNGKYVIFKGEDGWGVMTLNEAAEVIIKPKYSNILLMNKDKFFAIDNKDYYVLNKDGDKELSLNDDFSAYSLVENAKFKFIGQEKSHFVLINEDGKPFNKLEFNKIITKISDKPISSNYFDIAGMVQNLVANITDKGIGQYFIGELASELGLNPENYKNDVFFKNENLDFQGYKYEIEFNGNTDESISINEYDFSLGKPICIINPESKVKNLTLRAVCQQNCWEKAKPLLLESLKAKGFKIEKDVPNATILINQYVSIYIMGRDDIIVLDVYPNDSETIQLLTQLLNINFAETNTPVSDSDDEYYPDPDIEDW